MPLFDTHAHYNDDAFDQNRKGLLDALPDAGVGAVVMPRGGRGELPLRPGPGCGDVVLLRHYARPGAYGI